MSKTVIHTHASTEAGILANAYLVETENGVIAVDGTLIRSEARALRAKIDALHKPLLAVLVTHAHPDHTAGITELVQSDSSIPVIALPSIDRVMRATEEAKHAQWAPIFQDEWIRQWTFPNRFVQNLEEVELDGIHFQVHDIGPGGDCDANSVWVMTSENSKAAFVGDLVFSGTHCYLADGSIRAWLLNIDNAEQYLDNVSEIYAGHGPAGGHELLAKQRDYLLTYCANVKELAQGNSQLSEEAKQELVTRMDRYLPNASLQFMISLSSDAVAAELALAGDFLSHSQK
ncbi:MBL fold metallo-hydrolase [Paenibacillus sp. N1-5-1-14]|uniref:MBL fold metallo-hydrolase n=1 Tax=Paenibacillus radicibacter TaxID=2972488 RepID=UPI0021590D4A|nr:MBL fold metallo-hydrolase [Paenibacillus radicibacter]MCR8644307.1 MBL fold metallo-hydrolase [Paenibacillus radicibacter]